MKFRPESATTAKKVRSNAASASLPEETGAKAAKYTNLGELYPSPGYCGEVIYMFLATGLTFGDTNPDEDEFLNVEKPVRQST